MKKNYIKFIYLLLFLFNVNIFFLGCATFSKNNHGALSKIYLNKMKTEILGNINGTVIQLLKISELPRKLFFREGTPLEYSDDVYNKSFRDAKLSPDKKYIAFSVESWNNEWSGIYDLTTKQIEKWNFFFDSTSGYFYWSPNGKYLVEESDSLKEGYHIAVKDFMKKEEVLTIGTDFLQKNGLASLQPQRVIRDDNEYIVFYEVRFAKWSEDSKRIFFKIVPECSYVQYEGVGDVQKRQMAEERKKIIREQEDMGLWSLDINSGALKKEE